MKNKNLIIWILAIISIVSTTALVTLAISNSTTQKYCVKHNNFKKRRNGGYLIKKLNLNDEQKDLFIKSKKEHFDKIFPIFGNIRTYRDTLFQELKKENPDSNIINNCVENISEYEKDIQIESNNHLLNVKKFLNKTQFDSLISFHSKAMNPKNKFSRYKRKCNNN
ncbi:MAG: hypothetical protein GX259_09980 [Bacteroidales bacterium]|nr:hypothetical protein [Bacteroidales bacterium]